MGNFKKELLLEQYVNFVSLSLQHQMLPYHYEIQSFLAGYSMSCHSNDQVQFSLCRSKGHRLSHSNLQSHRHQAHRHQGPSRLENP